MKKIVPTDAILIPDEAKRVFNGVIFDVYQWQQQLYDGSNATFERLKRTDTVLAVCVVEDKIVVIEDEQPGRGRMLKLPGGRVDSEDDSPLRAVKREILEETGYEFTTWKLANVVQPENKIEWFVHMYVASDMSRQQPPQQDNGERITVQLKDLNEVKESVQQGEGMLGYSRELFDGLVSIDDLKNMPEFQGKEVDR